MQPSQIQLTDFAYLGIKVVAKQPPEEEQGSATENFDFNGVEIGEGINLSILDEKQDDSKQFALKLHIVIANKSGKIAPYDIDIEVAGIFSIQPNSNIPVSERENFVIANGCAVLYGAIRDQVLTLTSRSARGPLMLPTVNFLDHLKTEKNSNTEM